MYNQLFVNIIFYFFPLDLQEKNHVAPKKRGNFGHLQENYKKLPKIVNLFFHVE
jgi:hypothetical protein